MARSKFDAPTRERLSTLAESFDVMRGHRGVRPFSIHRIVEAHHADHYPIQARLLAMTELGTLPDGLDMLVKRAHVIRFLLRITTHVEVVKIPSDSPLGEPFDVVGAMFMWSDAERAAFLAWLAERWTPAERTDEPEQRSRETVH